VSTPQTEPARPSAPGRTDFGLAPAIRARLLGTGLVAIGFVVLLGVVLTWLTDLSSAFVTGLVVLAVLGVGALGALVGVRHWVVRLDEHGYRVRVLRSAQARSARWTDVLDLQAATVGGQRCVVLRLRDGRTTTLPVDVIEGGPTRLTEALTTHLDRGHGYRRLS
jgi:hypothetical protein